MNFWVYLLLHETYTSKFARAADTTDTSIRYAAYANRIRTIMMSAQRYVAYTSDVGESFRPVAHPWLVRAAYGISWAYIIGDVTHEGYKAYCQQKSLLESSKVQHIPPLEDYRTVMAQRAVFQSIASMGLPAFTIHSVVKYSGKALKNAKNPTIRTWGPIGVRLDLIDGWNLFTDPYIAWSGSGSCTSIYFRQTGGRSRGVDFLSCI